MRHEYDDDDDDDYIEFESGAEYKPDKRHNALLTELRARGFDAGIWIDNTGSARVYINGILKSSLEKTFSSFSDEDLVDFSLWVEIEEKSFFVSCHARNGDTDKAKRHKSREIRNEVDKFLSERDVYEVMLLPSMFRNFVRLRIEKRISNGTYKKISRGKKNAITVCSIIFGVLLGIGFIALFP